MSNSATAWVSIPSALIFSTSLILGFSTFSSTTTRGVQSSSYTLGMYTRGSWANILANFWAWNTSAS